MAEPLHVGILTSGAHPVQTIYIPALNALPKLYTIEAVYSSDPESSSLFPSPGLNEILTSPSINLILNFMPNEYHELYTIAALQAGKHVMVETPVSLSIPSARRILDAEREAPNGARVFVASARRYAPCFENVFKEEVSGLERIHYARLRMIAGPHVAHTATNNTTPTSNNNNNNNSLQKPGASSKDRIARLRNLMEEIFGEDEQPNQERVALSRFLASLGCHDLGLMRDTLGYPDAVSNISVNEPFYSALFHYNGGVSELHPFTLMYEAGTDGVPRCDAQLAIYGQNKTVTIHYDLPYARGQPVRVVVEKADGRGGLMQTETVSTWEEAYEQELRALYAYLVEGKEAKTTAKDSLQDIKLFQTIFEQYNRQCGTIRTPLG
ncbi:hypothetical protein ASPVEDRAFT_126053 [Aspergillus versicolor CBS 583.65]|uniref:Gfo/Idh/MocA-like oxidoreductase N-terminal domain-containing protein n=1 Tax=Aspergillus versicolor CBS 583.65 TaxID=1036611 RepID=A0A1L9PAK9_ASPVE|nr:uncharacterized protein ASPVEDRAFT_126053 [Aspergillus versicolor CBS 583.65]OJI98551.1 hypothetical protein ASPVEDRAFT_126053 [Aspergillus versicolor CBS 583.65]